MSIIPPYTNFNVAGTATRMRNLSAFLRFAFIPISASLLPGRTVEATPTCGCLSGFPGLSGFLAQCQWGCPRSIESPATPPAPRRARPPPDCFAEDGDAAPCGCCGGGADKNTAAEQESREWRLQMGVNSDVDMGTADEQNSPQMLPEEPSDTSERPQQADAATSLSSRGSMNAEPVEIGVMRILCGRSFGALRGDPAKKTEGDADMEPSSGVSCAGPGLEISTSGSFFRDPDDVSPAVKKLSPVAEPTEGVPAFMLPPAVKSAAASPLPKDAPVPSTPTTRQPSELLQSARQLQLSPTRSPQGPAALQESSRAGSSASPPGANRNILSGSGALLSAASRSSTSSRGAPAPAVMMPRQQQFSTWYPPLVGPGMAASGIGYMPMQAAQVPRPLQPSEKNAYSTAFGTAPGRVPAPGSAMVQQTTQPPHFQLPVQAIVPPRVVRRVFLDQNGQPRQYTPAPGERNLLVQGTNGGVGGSAASGYQFNTSYTGPVSQMTQPEATLAQDVGVGVGAGVGGSAGRSLAVPFVPATPLEVPVPAEGAAQGSNDDTAFRAWTV